MILLMPPTDSYLVFDVETTGLNPWTDRIIQVGLVGYPKIGFVYG